MLREALGLRDGELLETNADDVDVAKPHPGIVQVALERAGASAEEAVLVGDATWDMIAAGRAGVAGRVGVAGRGVGVRGVKLLRRPPGR